MDPMFRYFLGFQVAVDRAGWLARQLPPVSGDLFAGLKPQFYHLTLCTIEETQVPHPFLRQRVANAFEAGLPAASGIPFGRIVSKDAGAELVTVGSIANIRHFYEALVALLAPYDIEPRYRQAGLRPHISLGYGKHPFEPVPVVWNWIPRELVLIESHVGHSRHRVLQRWPLLAPVQGMFDFMDDALPPPMRHAA